MKNRRLFKLRLIFGALLLVMPLSAGRYSSALASPGDIPAVAPERQTNPGDLPTNQIIIKYRDPVNATDSNGQIKTDKLNALSRAAGETLSDKRAMSGDAHVLKLPARMPPDLCRSHCPEACSAARRRVCRARLRHAPHAGSERPVLCCTVALLRALWHQCAGCLGYYDRLGIHPGGSH